MQFTTQTIPFEENRFIYLLSDGIKDQYGGPNKKKFSAKRFKEIIVEASFLPITEQKEFINKTIMDWKADYPQTDDMIVIGLKF